ncbi:MAG: hypothetical protein HOW73_48100 [Polyangiaceae bacterium]|nr:hypothetical protein [Polyangiaceae bacterium]
MVDTLETYLERARQAQTPIQLVLGGQIANPVTALVRDRNGPTFEFVIGTMVISMEIHNVVVRTA